MCFYYSMCSKTIELYIIFRIRVTSKFSQISSDDNDETYTYDLILLRIAIVRETHKTVENRLVSRFEYTQNIKMLKELKRNT